MREKLDKAINIDPDRAIYYLNQMDLWDFIPITEKLYPYYIKRQGK
jgi:hypothetical protein